MIKLNKIKVTSFLLSVIFSILLIIGYSIDVDYSFGYIVNNKTEVLITFFLLVTLFFIIIYNLYDLIINKDMKWFGTFKKISWLEEKYDNINKKTNNKFGFLLKVFIAFFVFMVFFLRFYPAVITPDTDEQIGIILGEYSVRNHHPIFHTLIIGFFLRIGRALFNSYNSRISYLFNFSNASYVNCYFLFDRVFKKYRVQNRI